MSALPPIADMDQSALNVRFVPTADIAPLHSITSSAVKSSFDGISARPVLSERGR